MQNQQPSDYHPIIAGLAGPNPFLTGPTASPYFNVGLPPSDPTYQGVLALNIARRFMDVTDGTSNTLLLVEVAGRQTVYLKGRQASTSPPLTNTGWASGFACSGA